MIGINVIDVEYGDSTGDCQCFIENISEYAPIRIIARAFKYPTREKESLTCNDGFKRP